MGCKRVDMISSLLSLISLLGSVLQDPVKSSTLYFLSVWNIMMFALHWQLSLLLSWQPGELIVVEHAILDGRLPVHLVHIVIGEPETFFYIQC